MKQAGQDSSTTTDQMAGGSIRLIQPGTLVMPQRSNSGRRLGDENRGLGLLTERLCDNVHVEASDVRLFHLFKGGNSMMRLQSAFVWR